MSIPLAVPTPTDVFYVVQSSGLLGQREHHVSSDLYELIPGAHGTCAPQGGQSWRRLTTSGKARPTSNRPHGCTAWCWLTVR